MAARGYCRFMAGETRAYSSSSTPLGILKGVLAACEWNALPRERLIKHGIDVDALEQAFAAIPAREFQKLLNVVEGHAMQITVVEALESVATRSTQTPRDPGTICGLIV